MTHNLYVSLASSGLLYIFWLYSAAHLHYLQTGLGAGPSPDGLQSWKVA